ncbi:GMC oxidoreductase [Mycena polygramma]|nr:GMC oxidoreductase [Mycena polygramma]
MELQKKFRLSRRLSSFDLPEVSSKTYSYIVVGGGTAGCVLASRLSEDPNTTVLLVERGPVVDGWMAGVPLLSSNITDQNAPIYQLQSAPLNALDGKTFTLITGKALGGTSKVNALLYTRSVAGEYNAWELSGRKGWGWEHVEPFFKKSETYLSDTEESYRGSRGPWQTRGTTDSSFKSAASDESIKFAPSLGVPNIEQANNPASPVVSCTRLDATIDKSGHRSATSDAFLPKKLTQTRKNLHICTETLVPALDIKNQKVIGVYLESDSNSGKRYHVSVANEVVLCAGAIFTPQILLLSGIGPADHLERHGIHIVKDLPGVGEHLQDHVSVPILYKVPLADSVDVLLENPLTAVGQLLKYFFTGKGMFGSQVQQANIMLRSSLLDINSHVVVPDGKSDLDGHDPSNIPDLEVMFLPVNPAGVRSSGLPKSAGTFTHLCTVLRPKSAGSVRLTSKNARDFPYCDLGTLTHPDDRIPLRKALRMALALGRAVRADNYPLDDLSVPASESDADLDAFINANASTTYHYSSSCRMADEPSMGVVDDRLRVHGILGLRIADASMFPHIPACHLQAPVVMVAERCAEFLKGDRVQ